jgi:hypothetical protein
MPQIPTLPITMVAKIRQGSVIVDNYYDNPTSVWHNFPYTFTCILDIIATPHSQEPNFSFNANDLMDGMWILQPNGNAFLITSITVINNLEANVTIKDVDLYNLVSDYTVSGNNYPLEDINSITIPISEDGTPITALLAASLSSNLDESSYWIDDAIARFQHRNIVKASYGNIYAPSVTYLNSSVGEIVYLDPTGVFIIVDTSIENEVEKAFGVITSLNEPEEGNITVRPFGRIVKTDFLLPGSIGDVLYFDSTESPSFVTNIKPSSGVIPVYIKISDYIGSYLHPANGGGGFQGSSRGRCPRRRKTSRRKTEDWKSGSCRAFLVLGLQVSGLESHFSPSTSCMS